MKSIQQVGLDFLKNVRQKGFFHLLSANMLIQVLSFASQLFVAGILSPDDIGRIKIVQTYLSIILIFAGMGFNSSTLKLCSENRTNAEKQQLFHSALLFTLISTVTFYCIVLILNYLRFLSSDAIVQNLIPMGLFPIITNSLFMVFVSYFQAIKKMKLISKLTISNKLISILSIVIITYLIGIKGYYLAYNISFAVMLVVSLKFIGKFKHKAIFSFQNFKFFNIHWQFARNAMAAYFLSELSAYVDILLISYLSSNMHQIGFYSFALTLTVVFRFFPSTVQQITIPYFSALSNQKADFRMAFKRYNFLLYTGVFATLGAVLLAFPPLINLIFSGKYNESFQYFPLLAIGWSLRQLVQLQNGAIFSLGKIQYNVYISLITLIFNLLSIGILVHFFGIIGACYASVLGGLVFMISSRLYYQKAYNEIE